MFYVLIFSLLAVVLIVGGIATMSRRRRNLEREEAHMHAGTPQAGATHSGAAHTDAARRTRKQKRAQSAHDRRKRH